MGDPWRTMSPAHDEDSSARGVRPPDTRNTCRQRPEKLFPDPTSSGQRGLGDLPCPDVVRQSSASHGHSPPIMPWLSRADSGSLRSIATSGGDLTAPTSGYRLSNLDDLSHGHHFFPLGVEGVQLLEPELALYVGVQPVPELIYFFLRR